MANKLFQGSPISDSRVLMRKIGYATCNFRAINVQGKRFCVK